MLAHEFCLNVLIDFLLEASLIPILGDTGFFRLQGIKVLWSLQFLGYLRTLGLKFQKATSKIEVRVRTTSILVRAFWNFKLKVLKYPRNFRLHNTLIPWSLKNLVFPTIYTDSCQLQLIVSRFLPFFDPKQYTLKPKWTIISLLG